MRAKQAGAVIKRSSGIGKAIGKAFGKLLLVSLISTTIMTSMTVQYNPGMKDTINEVKGSAMELADIVKTDYFNGVANILEAFPGEGKTEEWAQSVRDWANGIAKEDESLGEFQKATIIRVVDGDTIVVSIDNEQVKVRLIGVDTPESVASQEYLDKTGKENTQEGKDASAFTKELLSHYKAVYLESDKGDTDKYGRCLRYVWLEIPNEVTKDTIEEKMLQGILLSNGRAVTMSIKPNVKYAEEFSQIQEEYESER